MKGGREMGNMARSQLHSTRQWCLEEAVTKGEKSEQRPSAEPASSVSRWCMMIQVAECSFPNWAVPGSHKQADLLYCHWCITEQRHCKELWVIGFWFFFSGWSQHLPLLSQQAGDSERAKWNLYIHWLHSYPSVSLWHVFDFCCYKNNIIKRTQTTVIYNVWRISIIVCLVLLRF